MEGHADMDMSVTEGPLLKRLFSAEGFTAVSHYFVMDWASIWMDLVLDLAGAVRSGDQGDRIRWVLQMTDGVSRRFARICTGLLGFGKLYSVGIFHADPGARGRPRFRCRPSSFRCVIRGSLALVSLIHT